jgi:hypothetical protein
MKKTISQFVKYLGGSTKYSGKTKIMFIHHPVIKHDRDLVDAVIAKYGRHLSFRIVAQSKAQDITTW